MVQTCRVTGAVKAPDGSLLPNARVVFSLAQNAVTADGGDTVVPRRVDVLADEAGQIEADLFPALYTVRVTDAQGRGYPTFRAAVPAEDEARLADIQDMPEPAPPIINEVKEAADRAERARDGLLSNSLLYVGQTDIGVRLAIGRGVVVEESSAPYDSIKLRISAP